jgi:aerotaxis receptor
VRNIPAREEIEASEKLYEKVRNNELKHHRFYKGLWFAADFSFTSVFKRLSTTKRINIGITLTALFSCLLLFYYPKVLVNWVDLFTLYYLAFILMHKYHGH